MTAETAELTREQWAERTFPHRRRARAKQLLARARKDVALDSLPLTGEQWAAIAEVYAEAARSATVRDESAA